VRQVARGKVRGRMCTVLGNVVFVSSDIDTRNSVSSCIAWVRVAFVQWSKFSHRNFLLHPYPAITYGKYK
jgi:hypothetical protein